LDDLMPALCFMPTLKQEELVAALEHRISSLEGAIKHLEFSRDEIKPPDPPEHVKELYDRMRTLLSAEIPWARTLIDRLGRGVYELGDRKPPPPARPARGRRKASA